MPKKRIPKRIPKRTPKRIPERKPSVASLEKKYEKRKKTVSEKLAEIPWEVISKLTTSAEDMKTLMHYVDTMRQGMNRRIQLFKRRGIFSYAAESIDAMNIKNVPARNIVNQIMKSKAGPGKSKLATARNALIAEFAKYQQFFNSQTSSLEGIALVNAEQDKRIFGGEYQKKSMTDEERKVFWHIYEDFMESSSFVRTSSMTSETVQQYLASAMFDNGSTPEWHVENATVESGQNSFFDEHGIPMTFLQYEKGTKLRSMYEAYYKMQRAELETQIGRAERGENEFNIFSGGRNY